MIAIVLAAGKSKRIRSRTPKVLFPLLGRPVVSYPIEVARKSGARRIIVVVSPGSRLPEVVEGVEFAIQKSPLGTGDAVRTAMKKISGNHLILVLNGDNPLIRVRTIKRMVKILKRKRVGGILLTAVLNDPTGYGRIIKDRDGNILRIIEDRNLRREEKKIKEINGGAYLFRIRPLREALKRIRLDPEKREYLLTDTIAILSRAGFKTIGFSSDPEEAMGINTRKEYHQVCQIMKWRHLNRLLKKGVILEAPDTVIIDSDVEIESGVRVGPYVRIGKEVRIRSGTRIGPFSIIGDGQD